jgi:cyclopropane-fatty-acyl-phospholipid synthase
MRGKMSKARQLIETLAEGIDVKINGDRPWDIRVHEEQFFNRVAQEGSMGLGLSYMDGWWDCDALDELFFRIVRGKIREKITQNKHNFWLLLLSKYFNFQGKSKAREVAEVHYDLGNDLYQAMLDKHMAYSCGYWKGATTLDEAQTNKLDLVCKKVGLKKGDCLLDIGCGWGSLAKFAAENYGAEVVGVTVSYEQYQLAKERCKGLPVDIRLQDYRDVNEKFDRIISIGMFEHVGHKNYREYMEVASRCLKEDGLFCLHTIGQDISSYAADAWVDRFIFPNGMVPSIQQLSKAAEGLFIMEDWHNFGQYYDLTLMAWFEKFHAAWPSLKQHYDDRFYRKWEYYLKMFAGNFRARRLQLWQVVFSKHGQVGGYQSIR